MDKLYMSIDVGSKGVICTNYNGDFKHYYIADNDLYQLSKIMAEIRSLYENIACVIEDVQAIYGSAASATFSFGFNKGYLIGLLCANNIPYTLVQPKQWQREMWNNSDIVVKYKKVTNAKGYQVWWATSKKFKKAKKKFTKNTNYKIKKLKKRKKNKNKRN